MFQIGLDCLCGPASVWWCCVGPFRNTQLADVEGAIQAHYDGGGLWPSDLAEMLGSLLDAGQGAVAVALLTVDLVNSDSHIVGRTRSMLAPQPIGLHASGGCADDRTEPDLGAQAAERGLENALQPGREHFVLENRDTSAGLQLADSSGQDLSEAHLFTSQPARWASRGRAEGSGPA